MANLEDIAKELNIDKKDSLNKTSYIKKEKGNKRRTWLEEQFIEQVNLIDTNEITNWQYHDRPENELGDIKSLAAEFLKIGQQQPCLIRASNSKEFAYELIIGERRWRAAKLAGVKLKVIIKDLDDSDAALVQAAENDNRLDLSDYAKSMSYCRLISDGIIKQSDLINKLGRSKQYVSALLSYSKLPVEIKEAIGDFSKVSCRTAETIKRLSNKGDVYVKAILLKAKPLRDGVLGSTKLSQYVKEYVNKFGSNHVKANKVISSNGRHLFTIRNDNNSFLSIHFPKDISNLFKENIIDTEEFNNKIKDIIENDIDKIK